MAKDAATSELGENRGFEGGLKKFLDHQQRPATQHRFFPGLASLRRGIFNRARYRQTKQLGFSAGQMDRCRQWNGFLSYAGYGVFDLSH